MQKSIIQLIYLRYLDFRQRKQIRAFKEHFAKPLPSFSRSEIIPTKYDCPCCGYPTLDERGDYDICSLCNWEDDGTDGTSGFSPNHGHINASARENFKKYLVMYSPDEDPRVGGGDSPTTKLTKQWIVGIYERLKLKPGEEEKDQLMEDLHLQYRILYQESKRKLAEDEQLHKRK